jgi:type I restriction enzyme R subunit
LRIATIFTFGTNEEDEDAQDYLPDEELVDGRPLRTGLQSKHTRDKLEEFIDDYNKMYGTAFSTKTVRLLKIL